MSADPIEARAPQGALHPATVTDVGPGRLGVTGDAFGAASVRCAVPGYRARVGDAVLVGEGAGGERYVVGVLRALREVEPSVETEDGASARVERDEEGEVLRVRDARGRLVFEHREGRSVVHAPDGDLELSTGGRLELSAARGVHVDAGDAFEARARGPVSLRSGTEATSELSLDGPDARVAATSLRAVVERASAELKEANLVVGTLRTVAHRVKERAETVERTAGRVVESAREVYREVEELSQTRAGRLRLVAEKALYAIGGETVLKAREDVKITAGDKIYLA